MTSHQEQHNRYNELDAPTQAALDRLVNAIASYETGGQMDLHVRGLDWAGVLAVFIGIVHDTGREMVAS